MRADLRPYLEGAVTGLAYAGALVALGTIAVGSFRPGNLSFPYWGRIGWLRTDTFGIACFFMAVVAFTCSEFLRLSRIAGQDSSTPRADAGPLALLILAAARVVSVASATLVGYLSVNAVTHPETLGMPVTHLFSFPTEGTVRAAALVITACAVAVTRTQRITLSRASRV